MLKAGAVTLLTAFAISSMTGAIAQEPTDAEKVLAAKINCKDFTRNPDGSWTSGPNARIGSLNFGNNTFPARGGFEIGGADIGVVLDQKCGVH